MITPPLNPLRLPPLSLYIHIPWCVQKCPYCDFNSHAQKGAIPEQEYVRHLLADLAADLSRYQESIQQRPLHSIFIGGGTPSLFSAENIAFLLHQIEQHIPFAPHIEITLEANPGTAEAERFLGYVQAGVIVFLWAFKVFLMKNCKNSGVFIMPPRRKVR